jgi:hypothetical protein
MDKLPEDASLILRPLSLRRTEKMTDDLFVDTLYLVARLNPKDQWHKAALDIERFRQMSSQSLNHQKFTNSLSN